VHPEIIGTTNLVAFKLAREIFPNALVLHFPDFQIESYKDSIKDCGQERSYALVLLEPESKFDSKFAINSDQVLKLVKSAIAMKNRNGLKGALLRLHPSQSVDDDQIQAIKQLFSDIEVSKSATLIEDLQRSSLVLGLNTYAMYISVMCGIDTYSCFGGMHDHWTKNFPQITVPPAWL
jgi:hypothetical protein